LPGEFNNYHSGLSKGRILENYGYKQFRECPLTLLKSEKDPTYVSDCCNRNLNKTQQAYHEESTEKEKNKQWERAVI